MSQKKLYRSYDNRMIGGVSAGFADYFNVDVTIVRLAWAFLSFFMLFGFFLYIICWIIIPLEPVGRKKSVKEESLEVRIEGFGKELESVFKGREDLVGGVFLIILGSAFLVNNFFPLVSLFRFWPLIIVLVGLLVIVNGRK